MDHESIQSLERHIKIFSKFTWELEQLLHPNHKNKIETTPNLHGLFNIGKLMEEYGPLRLYWEGGYKGEALIQSIKPMIKNGVHKKHFKKTFTAILQRQVLQRQSSGTIQKVQNILQFGCNY